MPEYLAPGVYVEEIASGPVPIQGVSTSTAGFVGLTERGPTQPRMVTGWGDYVSWFGGLIDPGQSFLPWAVKGFFDNGGQRLFVARVVRTDTAVVANNAVTAVLDHPTSDPAQLLRVEGIGAGAWANRIFLRIEAGTNFDPASPPPRPPISITVLYYATMPPGHMTHWRYKMRGRGARIKDTNMRCVKGGIRAVARRANIVDIRHTRFFTDHSKPVSEPFTLVDNRTCQRILIQRGGK